MNNSFERLIDGMVATLRAEIIPKIGSEFARGQAFGVIYMLNSMRLRAAWSTEFYLEQIAAQTALRDALAALVEGLDAPALPQAASGSSSSPVLEALRNANEGRISDLIVWLSEQGPQIDTDKATAIDAALHIYMNRHLKHELVTSAKPMFAEISAGAE
ncbi:MAG: hypothetical protein JWQ90_4345 [Hydrocarboniphaga sp.]|uniref:hypothetical protein n=1 Tax=Hydrocarboniphaga sp. TaxID=2033016 RepID=UPI00263601C8|nr:hypothetical protein [Hydrocarboniphaga sp.]MDB5971895.1 hypothetical protein [Hydrocarboniphaga sp.]